MICRFIVSHNTCNDSLYSFFFVPAKSERISFNPIQLNPIQLSPIEFSPVTSSWPDSWNSFLEYFLVLELVNTCWLFYIQSSTVCSFWISQSKQILWPPPPSFVGFLKDVSKFLLRMSFYLFIHFFLGSVVVFLEFIIWGPVRNLWCSFRHFFFRSEFFCFRCVSLWAAFETSADIFSTSWRGSQRIVNDSMDSTVHYLKSLERDSISKDWARFNVNQVASTFEFRNGTAVLEEE